MKKTILFFAAVALLSLGSCKQWTCSCSDGSSSKVSGANAVDAQTHCVAKDNGNKSCSI